MYIANPIYDVAFKYLMEDNKVAKQVISTIINEEVLELDFAPQEHTYRSEKSCTVYRMDFMAKIATPDGSKAVIIEMQKAKLASDIIRFRRYLGGRYQDKENGAYIDEKGVRRPLPIYCIFFLGYELAAPPSPVLEVSYHIKDVATGEELNIDSEFIKGLHHKSWIIQIPHLKKHRRNRLEQLLAIFDQDNIASSDKYILKVREEDFPDEYRPIIRRLQQAAESPKMQDDLEMEDIYIEEFRSKERENLKALEEKEKALEVKDKTIEEKDKTIEEQSKTLEAKEKEIEELKRRLNKE
ncbi:MAG: hypothetical protein LBQ39_04440 [Tannerellaceae bacterium]|jgi:hypothetical protein|nr:hypothetical protein [Tannerellaceae bacterium]